MTTTTHLVGKIIELNTSHLFSQIDMTAQDFLGERRKAIHLQMDTLISFTTFRNVSDLLVAECYII